MVTDLEHLPPLGYSDHEVLLWSCVCYNDPQMPAHNNQTYDYFRGDYIHSIANLWPCWSALWVYKHTTTKVFQWIGRIAIFHSNCESFLARWPLNSFVVYSKKLHTLMILKWCCYGNKYSNWSGIMCGIINLHTVAICDWIFKNRPKCHTRLFHFVGPVNSYIHTLYFHSGISRLSWLVCFPIASFANHVKSWLI